MFIGHFALAFGIKRAVPEIKLGTAVIAACFLDIVWPVLLLLGLEVVKIDPDASFSRLRFVTYPFSHSLAMALWWGVLFAAVYRWRCGAHRGALWLGALVVSHWFLDLIVHQPDLQLLPEIDVYVGIGLWDHVGLALLVESALFAAGLGLYLSATRARDRIGVWGLWGLVALLLASYVAATFGPLPPSANVVAMAGLVGTAVAAAWAYWVDRHRAPAA